MLLQLVSSNVVNRKPAIIPELHTYHPPHTSHTHPHPALLMKHLKRRRALPKFISLSLVVIVVACVLFRVELRAALRGWFGL